MSGKKDKNYKAQKEKMESLAKTVQYFEEEREELITELKLLRALATNGLITTSIVHDLKSINALLVNRVEPMRMAIENDNKMLIERNLNDLYKNDQFLKSWITVVTNQSKKDKRKRLKKNIYDTIEKIVNVLQPILVQKKVQVELIKDEQNAERRIFESDFESIFYNLIINSIEAFSKSSTKNRKIRIELKTNENLVVNYLDNGDGLDNKFKNPYEIFTLGSTSKYDQFRNCKLMLMFLLKEQTQDEVNKVFDYLTEVLGIELFQKLFEVIITDNGHEFQDRWNLECDDNGEMRTRIYYCDPNRSDQKGALEKNHEYIRYVLPKGTSFENITEETTLLLLNHINSEKRDSLNGHSPYEVSRILLDNRLHEALGLIEIPADEVTLIPALVK